MVEQAAFFVCDMQDAFKTAIHGWEHVVKTTTKLIDFAVHIGLSIYYTTQVRAKLGDTVAELRPRAGTDADVDKTFVHDVRT